MAITDENMLAWRYDAGNSVYYRLRAKKLITDQVDGSLATKVGGQAAATTVSLPVRGFRPRRVYVVDSATKKIRRAVVCYSPDAPLLTAGVTINLEHAGVETAFESTGGLLGQKLPAGITDAS